MKKIKIFCLLVVIVLSVVFLLTATACGLFGSNDNNTDNKKRPSTEQQNNNSIDNSGIELKDAPLYIGMRSERLKVEIPAQQKALEISNPSESSNIVRTSYIISLDNGVAENHEPVSEPLKMDEVLEIVLVYEHQESDKLLKVYVEDSLHPGEVTIYSENSKNKISEITERIVDGVRVTEATLAIKNEIASEARTITILNSEFLRDIIKEESGKIMATMANTANKQVTFSILSKVEISFAYNTSMRGWSMWGYGEIGSEIVFDDFFYTGPIDQDPYQRVHKISDNNYGYGQFPPVFITNITNEIKKAVGKPHEDKIYFTESKITVLIDIDPHSSDE